MQSDIQRIFTNEFVYYPSRWEALSMEDRVELVRLYDDFRIQQKNPNKDKKNQAFQNELITLMEYIEHSDDRREERAILIGVAFIGQLICVNTRQLKGFLGRCKSSINGSFQQLGYVALKTKAKARESVLEVLPSLAREQNMIRQWTVRCATKDSNLIFPTKMIGRNLPHIVEEDLFDEKSISQRIIPIYNHPSPPIVVPTLEAPPPPTLPPKIPPKLSSPPPVPPLPKKRGFGFDLSCFQDLTINEAAIKIPEMTPSFSVDFLNDFDDEPKFDYDEFMPSDSYFNSSWEDSQPVPRTMTRSQSALIHSYDNWF